MEQTPFPDDPRPMMDPLRAALLSAGACLAACGGSDGGGSTPAPAATSVVLNEIDVNGRDWVELVNPTGEPADLSGWLLSDAPGKAGHDFGLPAGTVLEPGGRLVVKSEKVPGDGNGLPFGLKSGETVALLSPQGGTAHAVPIGPVPAERTWGRYPDATGPWQVTLPTQGAPNEAPYDLDALLFDPRSPFELELTLAPAAIAALEADPYVYERGEVRLERGGEEVGSAEAGVRLKGGLSFQPLGGKASFKLRFDEYDQHARLLGLKRLTLNGMVDDPSRLRETVAYRLFRDAGVPAARTGYAVVSVNGADYGLYLVLEPYDDVAMAERFPDTAHVYEASADLYAGQVGAFEVDVGSGADITDLEALIAAVNGARDATWIGEVSALLDLDAFVLLWAVETLVGHWDGYAAASNNYFLQSAGDGRFTMLPSGLDRTFERAMGVGDATSLLAARCLAVAACRSRFDRAHEAVARGAGTALASGPWLDELAAVVEPLAAADPKVPSPPAAQEAALGLLREFLATE